MKIKYEIIFITLPKYFSEQFIIQYLIKYKKHWWSRWHYIMDEKRRVPELFTVEQIFEPHFSKYIKEKIK